ncbi:hypothetical protein M0R45_030536 [Rubus argutus]|uniref:Uncharacterized protein n=1 Tax=Rubus argutus TaxID=59490 RepID=A0AAW1WDJ6_RUBAR
MPYPSSPTLDGFTARHRGKFYIEILQISGDSDFKPPISSILIEHLSRGYISTSLSPISILCATRKGPFSYLIISIRNGWVEFDTLIG